MTDDKIRQQEEIEALVAIYSANFEVESETRVRLILDDSVQLLIDLPSDYPSSAPPNFELSGPALSKAQKTQISNRLQEIYLENIGEPIIYSWAEAVKEEIEAPSEQPIDDSDTQDDVEHTTTINTQYNDTIVSDAVPPQIFSGPSITDRKSAFQAHLAQVTCKEEVNTVLATLKSNGKIARATHNIFAYRIIEERRSDKGELRTIKHQDSEDDGETGAGPKLLHLLEIIDAQNVIVVVTRWYGGIHLGPDRFRHICNIARDILVEHGYGNKPGDKKKPTKR